MARGPSKKGIEGRFWDKISPEPNSGCWLWTGGGTSAGYGQLCLNGVMRLAHRVVYEHYRGAIPESLSLDHLCRVRCCVNPDHLEPVTHQENMWRGMRGKLKTHCLRGHLYSEENTLLRPDGRACRTCEVSRKNTEEYRAGRKAYALEYARKHRGHVQ